MSKPNAFRLVVGMPCRNEGLAVLTALAAIGRAVQRFTFEVPVAVCLNAESSSADASLLREVSERGLAGHILHEERPGKCFALNRIMQTLEADIYIFVDADVIVEPQSLVALYEALLLEPQGVPAKGGELWIANRDEGLVCLATQYLGKDVFQEHRTVLYGGFFAIRRCLVPSFPPVLSIDLYLSTLLRMRSPATSARCPEAKAAYRHPSTYGDYVRKAIRSNYKVRQLHRVLPPSRAVPYEDFQLARRGLRTPSFAGLRICLTLLFLEATAAAVGGCWRLVVLMRLCAEPVAWNPSDCLTTKFYPETAESLKQDLTLRRPSP